MIVTPADRLNDVGEYYFSQKLEVIRKMRLAGHDVINLGIGSPDLAPPQPRSRPPPRPCAPRRTTVTRLTAATPELQARDGRVLRARLRRQARPRDRGAAPVGSKEGILYVSMAFLNPGDKVLVPNPGYPAYSSVSALVGAKIVHYDLNEESGWSPGFRGARKGSTSPAASSCGSIIRTCPRAKRGAPSCSRSSSSSAVERRSSSATTTLTGSCSIATSR